MKELQNKARSIGNRITGGIKAFWNDEAGMGTVEVISGSFLTLFFYCSEFVRAR